jgi:hypothetical protein
VKSLGLSKRDEPSTPREEESTDGSRPFGRRNLLRWGLLGRSYVGLAALITLTWDFVVWRGRLVSTSG